MADFEDLDYDDYEEVDEDVEDGEEDSSEEEEDENTVEEECENTDEQFDQNYVENIKDYIGFPMLTKNEKTRVVAVRVEQILAGAKIFVDPIDKNPMKIALQEIKEKKCPLMVKRTFFKITKIISVNELS